MKIFYVTFGMGTILRGYYLPVLARDRDIVAAWLDRKEQIRWSNIVEEKPQHSEPLRTAPEQLHYNAAEHI